jgi:2-(1,2-epoxy-1,2-dihydrophenyl)acetyl-CoA isomerase
MPEYRDIRYAISKPLAHITLDKPQKLNALSWSTMAEIESAVERADDDDDVRVVVIAGAGRGFCSGMDLSERTPESEWSPRPEKGREMLMRSRHLFTSRVYRCRKPTIAAVNGVAAGAGFSLALACDIRIAAESARFSAIFVKRATVADTGCTWQLPRLIGMERALRMMWTGRLVPAMEALQIGLVSEVVPDGELMKRVEEVAMEIANGPAIAIEMDKRLAHEGLFRTLDDQIEQEEYSMNVTNRTEDFKEGASSFREKRDPVFKGR